jgi:thiamine-phosphate pyrophosphorylase
MITDRHQYPAEKFFEVIKRALRAGIDFLQIREKDLPARPLCRLVERTLELARPHGTPVLVNDRFDVALACGAQGVHLPARGLPVAAVKRATRGRLLIGVSTHSLAEARAAERGGADYILFGPIFATPSKVKHGPPVGLDALQEVTAQCQLPVIALGGINLSNFQQILDRGARGIAGISLFSEARNLARTVRMIRSGPHFPPR